MAQSAVQRPDEPEPIDLDAIVASIPVRADKVLAPRTPAPPAPVAPRQSTLTGPFANGGWILLVVAAAIFVGFALRFLI